MITAIGISSLPVLYAVSITVNAAQSMAYTALLSAMMDKCEPATAATDYTFQVSVVYIGKIAASVLSGAIASATGYTFMFIISAALSLFSYY